MLGDAVQGDGGAKLRGPLRLRPPGILTGFQKVALLKVYISYETSCAFVG